MLSSGVAFDSMLTVKFYNLKMNKKKSHERHKLTINSSLTIGMGSDMQVF